MSVHSIINKKIDLISRKFFWQNSKKRQIETILSFSRKTLKEEIKNFGIVFSMVHPKYLEKQGFKKFMGNYVIDYQRIFQRNIFTFKGLTRQLVNSLGNNNGYDCLSEFLCFIQEIPNKIPPKFFQGRYIREFLTPIQCLYEKYGDCDTKSILLAEFLANFSDSKEKLILMIVKGYGIFHAVLLVKRKPLPGMFSVSIANRGIYIPLETTAKNWSPGFIGQRVIDCLKSGYFRLEQLY